MQRKKAPVMFCISSAAIIQTPEQAAVTYWSKPSKAETEFHRLMFSFYPIPAEVYKFKQGIGIGNRPSLLWV